MPYKVEIYTKQFFIDGKFQNNTEEKWFYDEHELSARNEAFIYLGSFKPKSNLEIEIILYYSEDRNYTIAICSTFIYSKEELAEEGIDDDEDCWLSFNFENLHLEYESYLKNGYDTGGEPHILTDESILNYDNENDEEIEMFPVVLSANKHLFNH
jgi:hypothetical protein